MDSRLVDDIITGSMLSKDYTILRFLGHGSFGKIYLLEHSLTSEKVVDKVIPLYNLTPEE